MFRKITVFLTLLSMVAVMISGAALNAGATVSSFQSSESTESVQTEVTSDLPETTVGTTLPPLQQPMYTMYFETWYGEGESTVTINANIFYPGYGAFEYIMARRDNAKLDPSDYTYTQIDGSFTLTLSEEFLKTYPPEYTEWFTLYFNNVRMNVQLNIRVNDKIYTFKTWSGSGNASVRVEAALWDSPLTLNGTAIHRSNFTVDYSDSDNIWEYTVTLKEKYLKTLPDGNYRFVIMTAYESGYHAYFKEGEMRVYLDLTVDRTAARTLSASPKTGDENGITAVWVILFQSAVGAALLRKKRKL